MKILTWVLRVLLAAAYTMAGFTKLLQPYEKLLVKMSWAENFSPTIVKLIGLIELLGVLGFMLPIILKIKPRISILALRGLALTMVGAFITHLLRGEIGMLIVPIILLAITLFVAKRTSKELG